MIEVIRGWFDKHFSDPQAILLVTFIVVGVVTGAVSETPFQPEPDLLFQEF